jgi:endonuclease/exonuclease/phosphatase family metal-dependent hydrolase
MSRRVIRGVRVLRSGLLAAAVVASIPAGAQAQTTVVLDAPGTEAVDTTVRGGEYAGTNYDDEPLMTRASGTTDFVRRALLKFDTESRVPSRAAVRSATLTLTVKGGNSERRVLSAFRVAQSFEPAAATWRKRTGATSWNTSGGDLGRKYAQAGVTAAAGSKVTFDVTVLVQEAVNGDFGSRWTRVAIVDEGPAARASYREYYPTEANDPSVRPVLTVVYGGTSTKPTKPPKPPKDVPKEPTPEETDPTPAPPQPPPPPDDDSGSTSTLRVFHWNLYHGQNAKKKWGFDRQMEVIAKARPDIVSLNEVEKFSSSYGNIDQAAEIASYLTRETGHTWYQYMRVGSGSSKGIGNAVLSRFPIVATSYCQLSDTRNAVQMTVVVNGRTLNVWSTHLAVESGSYRVKEADLLIHCMDDLPEQRLVAGDFNAQPGAKEIGMMNAGYVDTWAKAKSIGETTNYPGNCDGCTRNSRIDYLFTSTGASSIALKSAQMIDTRDDDGVMASDHKPMLAVFSVK